MKPGIRTTEWWATLLTHVFTVATSIYVLADQPFPAKFAYLQGLCRSPRSSRHRRCRRATTCRVAG
jgi:hypothetical protein